MVPGGEATRAGQAEQSVGTLRASLPGLGSRAAHAAQSVCSRPRPQSKRPGHCCVAALGCCGRPLWRARETDSAIVETVNNDGGSHFEKFLFYRGIGNFELPIKLAALGKDHFEVTNSAEDDSGALLLVRIEDGRVRFARMEPIGPRSAIEIDLPTMESTVDRLAEATVRELAAAGLYQKEALAMVNTWCASWFGENGTRLLYLVPGKLTDELLPLSVDPPPLERVRVLVGRLETLTPEDCQRLVHTLAGSGAGEQPTADSIKAELASLGRFAEPAIQFAILQTSEQPTRGRLEAILAGIRGGK